MCTQMLPKFPFHIKSKSISPSSLDVEVLLFNHLMYRIKWKSSLLFLFPLLYLWSSDSLDLIDSYCSSPPSRRVEDPQNTPLPVTRSAAAMMKRGSGETVIIFIIALCLLYCLKRSWLKYAFHPVFPFGPTNCFQTTELRSMTCCKRYKLWNQYEESETILIKKSLCLLLSTEKGCLWKCLCWLPRLSQTQNTLTDLSAGLKSCGF